MYHVVTFHELHEVQYLVLSENLDESIAKIEQCHVIDSVKLSSKLVDVGAELTQSDAQEIASSLNYSLLKESFEQHTAKHY